MEALLHPRKRVRKRGKTAPQFSPYTAEMMLRACRKLAANMRAEAAAGWGPIILWDGSSISRAEAAASMDRRGDMWAAEVAKPVDKLQADDSSAIPAEENP